MSILWNHLIQCQNDIIDIFNDRAVEFDEPGLAHFNSDTWVNRVWHNDSVRRAHIDVVDAMVLYTDLMLLQERTK